MNDDSRIPGPGQPGRVFAVLLSGRSPTEVSDGSHTQPRKLVASALVLFVLCFVYNMVVIEGGFIPPLLVFAVVSLVLAGAMLQPWRWAPPMATVSFLLVFATSVPIIVDDLSGANGVHQLLWQVVTTLVAAAASGVVATVRDRRSAAGGQRAAA